MAEDYLAQAAQYYQVGWHITAIQRANYLQFDFGAVLLPLLWIHVCTHILEYAQTPDQPSWVALSWVSLPL